MTRPALAFRVAFGSDPDATNPPYTDASSFLLAASTKRGRNFERDQIDAGTGSAQLDNGDRRFDPTYTLSPYNPDVVPIVKTQLVATWSGSDYYLLTSYVERWPIEWQGPTWGTSTPTLVDAMGALARAQVSGTFAQELSGTRIANLLAAIGWPASTGAPGYWTLGTSALGTTAVLSPDVPLTALDAGQSLVQAVTITEEQPQAALSLIQEAAQADGGVFFFNGQGRAVFHDRHHRYTVASELTFSDRPTGGEVYYENLVPQYDAERIANEIVASTTISSSTVTVITVDAASQALFWRRTKTFSPALVTESDLQGRAELELLLYSQPQLRFERLMVRPESQDAWATVLALEIGDKVTVKRTPGVKGGTPETITQTCFVESVEHTVTKEDWQVSFSLSPADAWENVWLLGTGALDTTTKLAY